MNDTCATRDLVKQSGTRWLLWGLPTAIMLLSVYFAGSGWIVAIASIVAACGLKTAPCPLRMRPIRPQAHNERAVVRVDLEVYGPFRAYRGG